MSHEVPETTPRITRPCISSQRTSGSMTIPRLNTQIVPGLRTPDGMWWRMIRSSFTTKV